MTIFVGYVVTEQAKDGVAYLGTFGEIIGEASIAPLFWPRYFMIIYYSIMCRGNGICKRAGLVPFNLALW